MRGAQRLSQEARRLSRPGPERYAVDACEPFGVIDLVPQLERPLVQRKRLGMAYTSSAARPAWIADRSARDSSPAWYQW